MKVHELDGNCFAITSCAYFYFNLYTQLLFVFYIQEFYAKSPDGKLLDYNTYDKLVGCYTTHNQVTMVMTD